MSRFTDWITWASNIKSNRWVADPEDLNPQQTLENLNQSLTTKIIGVRGEVIPGWLTFDLGRFNVNDVFYAELQRSVSLKIPDHLVDEVQRLLAGQASDQDVVILLNYALTSYEVLAQYPRS